MGGSYAALMGFESPGAYLRALKRAPGTVAARAFATRSPEQQRADSKQASCGGEMQKCLGALDLTFLGVGMMLGAGVFVTTGAVAATHAGPAVVVCYAMAGFSALLSSLCYAEFAANMPLSGGAYSYISAVFGEFLAWVTVMNLILEYILSNAAVTRGFSPYFAMLVNKPPSALLLSAGRPGLTEIDPLACAWVLLLTALLVLGTKESARFNFVMTVLHLLLVAFIIVAGFVKSSPANLQPFLPFGYKGIFTGASIVFFSFIGFDAVATSAEEVKNPKRDLPLGILGALSIVTIAYVLMALVLCMMLPLSLLQGAADAAFAAAFSHAGLDWARSIVALGALVGIVTGSLVGMYAVSRIIAAVARQHLLPPFLARVHPRFGTPWVATLLSGFATAIIALFTDFDELLNMVSISTLFAFWMVALALLWHRYRCRHAPWGSRQARRNALTACELALLVAASIAFTICHGLAAGPAALAVCGAGVLAAAGALFATGRQGAAPESYGVPLFPLVPALSVALNTFMLGQLDSQAYIRFAVWTGVVTAFYALYAALAAAQHHSPGGDDSDSSRADALQRLPTATAGPPRACGEPPAGRELALAALGQRGASSKEATAAPPAAAAPAAAAAAAAGAAGSKGL